MILRPRQTHAIDALRSSYQRGRRAPLLVVPTGGGKTVIASAIIRSAVERGRKVLFLAHRAELITQSVRKLAAAGVHDVRVIQAAADLGNRTAPVSVASIPTLTKWGDRMPDADLCVFDEAHHTVAKTWKSIADRYASSLLLGMSATPQRSDGSPMGDVFDDLVVGASMQELIDDGHLVSCRIWAPPFGSLEKRELALSPAQAYREHGNGQRAVIFCASRKHAAQVSDEMNAAGFPCGVVHGSLASKDRAATLARLASGELRAVANVFVLCLDDQTEILTADGWKGIDELADDHQVANWDDGDVTFEKPLEIVRRERREDESMISLDSQRMSIRVTATHRMLYRTLQGGQFLKCPAIDLIGRHVELPVSGRAAPLPIRATTDPVHTRGRLAAIRSMTYNLIRREGYTRDDAKVESVRRVDRRSSIVTKHPHELSLDECRLIGFWLGDGSLNRIQRGGVEYTLTQSKVYPKIIEWIDGVLSRTGIHSVRREKTEPVDHVRWSLPRGTGGGSQERIGVRPIEPYLDKEGSPLLWGLDESQFDAFIAGFWLADGLHGDGTPVSPKRSLVITNTNHAMLSKLQAIASVRGYGTRLRKSGAPAKAHYKQIWHFSLRKKDSFFLGTTRFVEEKVWIPERVWCVRTRTKNIVTRRNGTVAVMGNTEGWDLPSVSVCILARKPQHAGTYLQMVGRVLRADDEKTHATLLDLMGASLEHGPLEMERVFTLDGKGISKVDRDRIRQCPSCGAVFVIGPRECPTCGVALLGKRFEPPTVKGVGLVEQTRGPAVDQLLLNLRAVAKRTRRSEQWVERARVAIGGVR